MISRRFFMGSGIGLGLVASAPLFARGIEQVPLVIKPGLFEGLPPAQAITESGNALLARLYPFDRTTTALTGFTDAADAAMLRELVRVQSGASWDMRRLPAGSETPLGPTLLAAVAFEARWS